MKCRLLYLVGQLGAGGLERQLYLLLRTMDRDRYRPEVVVWNYNPDDTYVVPIRKLKVPLHHFPRKLSAAGKAIAFRRIVRKIQPEVIHSYSFYTNIAASWGALGTQTIAVGGLRSNFINDKKSCGIILGNLCAKWPTNQVYNNFAAADTARNSQSLFSPKQVLVVQNRIDLEEFRSIPLVIHGQVRILALGSLLPCKRWDRLLCAASNLKRREISFLLQFAGGGPLRKALEQQAEDLGVRECVEFLGHTDNVAALLSLSTFLAHTADVEGCPNVVMEAMASGRAVVATDVGDIPFLVDDGKTGFVVQRGDDASLVDRLARLINDVELCQELGHAGRLKAEREFGLERLVTETLAAYRSAGWRAQPYSPFRQAAL